MDIKVPVKELSIGPHVVYLSLKQQTPLVDFQNQTFNHLWFLVNQLPELSNPLYIKEFAQISNFFWKGLLFQYIDSVPAYQKRYIEQVEMEKKYPADIFEYRLTDYKIFDVSVMHEPKVEQDTLIYFVYNVSNGLPYRVVCPFPYTSTSPFVHYQILPIKE
ncbi:hypothetical protein [Candidatus Protochlamydia phocaeensis]|uniref:hypothetical protein n=1 Tax=Candidatus Protochlamydia phocaeensis TaxID=1414722 RepID=UPI000838E113|nr:hypothetical protein [Candidatus Protochlamydia phocaeensis]